MAARLMQELQTFRRSGEFLFAHAEKRGMEGRDRDPAFCVPDGRLKHVGESQAAESFLHRFNARHETRNKRPAPFRAPAVDGNGRRLRLAVPGIPPGIQRDDFAGRRVVINQLKDSRCRYVGPERGGDLRERNRSCCVGGGAALPEGFHSRENGNGRHGGGNQPRASFDNPSPHW